MTPIEIALIIIGAAILIASFFLSNNSKPEENAAPVSERELSLTEIETIKEKINELISVATEGSLIQTSDRLNQLSNEKIIAVNDFSEQVLEKISQNHEEVVFLYNMLNEKEREVKDLIKDIDKVKRQINETENNEQSVEMKKENTANTVNAVQNNHTKVPVAKIHNERFNPINAEEDKQVENYNQKILEMYSQGFSIIDISKTLELGQGEVKLVIDLYNNKNN